MKTKVKKCRKCGRTLYSTESASERGGMLCAFCWRETRRYPKRIQLPKYLKKYEELINGVKSERNKEMQEMW